MKVNALIASLAIGRNRRAGRARTGTANRQLAPDVVRGLAPALVTIASLVLLVVAVALLSVHPLGLIALWVGAMGLLLALPFTVVQFVGEVLLALER